MISCISFRAKNHQSFDLGFDSFASSWHQTNAESHSSSELQELEEQIDLVMITEYMAESMILLKVNKHFANN